MGKKHKYADTLVQYQKILDKPYPCNCFLPPHYDGCSCGNSGDLHDQYAAISDKRHAKIVIGLIKELQTAEAKLEAMPCYGQWYWDDDEDISCLGDNPGLADICPACAAKQEQSK